MAEPIDDLFVRLGLETDDKQFNKANQMFGQLRTRALQFGAVIGAGFGLRELTTGFSEATDEMSRFAETFSVAPEFVDRLGFAFQQTGGDAQDAFSSIRNVANLIEQTDWGEIPAQAFREFGVDPRVLQGVESVSEAYDRLVGATRDLDPETARRFMTSLGFGEAEIRLFRGQGDDSLRALLAEAEARAALTEEMREQAREFQQARGRAGRSATGVSREISNLFVGDLADSLDRLADFMQENRDAIVNFTNSAIPLLKDAAMGIAAIAAYQAARAGLGALSNLPFATTVAVGGFMAARHVARNRDEEEMQRQREEMTPLQRGLFGGGGTDALNLGARQASQTNNITVDARGSTSPAETEMRVRQAIEQVIPRMAENAILDIDGDVK